MSASLFKDLNQVSFTLADPHVQNITGAAVVCQTAVKKVCHGWGGNRKLYRELLVKFSRDFAKILDNSEYDITTGFRPERKRGSTAIL